MGSVSSSGSSSLLRKALFPNGFAGEVMCLISQTWKSFQLPSTVNLEEPITALLADQLTEEYTRRGLPWFIFPELPITNKKTGKQEARTDLNFYHRDVPGQSKVFTIECKRLHVSPPSGFKSLVNDYFQEGLLRFVNERYSVGQPCGGMLGYVMDKNLTKAFKDVKSKVESSPLDFKLKKGAEWTSPSTVISGAPFSADTQHVRKNEGNLIIHHLLV